MAFEIDPFIVAAVCVSVLPGNQVEMQAKVIGEDSRPDKFHDALS